MMPFAGNKDSKAHIVSPGIAVVATAS